MHRDKKKKRVIATGITIGLTHKPAVKEAKEIISAIVERAPTTHVRKEHGRDFWSFTVSADADIHKLGVAMFPHLRVKKLEMELLLSVTSRKLSAGYHTRTNNKATDLDFAMMKLCQRLKRGDEKAVAAARDLLIKHPPILSEDELVSDEVRQWRDWYRRGASVAAIARHVGVTHHRVAHRVKSVRQTGNETPQSMGLAPKPHWPEHVSLREVKRWRKLAAKGISARKIAKKLGCNHQYVANATCDIRWLAGGRQRPLVGEIPPLSDS